MIHSAECFALIVHSYDTITGITFTKVSELTTGDSGIIVVPVVSANGSPCTIHTNLHCSLISIAATRQPDATIDTAWLCESF